MKKYSDYKNSSVPWIGEIPTTWNLSQLRYVIECLDGKRVPVELSLRADMQGNIPYWGAGNIVDYVDKALFDEELVLLGEDGAPFFDHTRPVAFHITEPIWANNHIHVLRIKENADPKYIVYVLNAVDYKEYINGAILNKLTQSAMNRIKIPLPPLSVQKKISKHLDKKVAAINALLTQKESLVMTSYGRNGGTNDARRSYPPYLPSPLTNPQIWRWMAEWICKICSACGRQN